MYNLIKRTRQTKKKKRTLNQERNLSTHIDLIISHLKFHDTMNPKKKKKNSREQNVPSTSQEY